MNEHIKWLTMALKYAKYSPDPRTQNGTIIVKRLSNRTSYVYGHNRFPVGIKPRFDTYMKNGVELDESKLEDIEHAERIAIYTAARAGLSLDKATMYCPWFACLDCAKAIIESGISKIVGSQTSRDLTPDRWKNTLNKSDILLQQAGIKIILIKEIIGVEIMFNGNKVII